MPRAHNPSLASRLTRSALIVATAWFGLSGCGGGDTEFALPKGDAALDAAAQRGDAMAASIAVGQAMADTMSRIARGELSPAVLAQIASAGSLDTTPIAASERLAGSGEGMTRRAQARGDSLARAAVIAYALEQSSDANRATGDTLRGVILLEGVAPLVRLALDTRATSAPVSLSGMATSELLRLEGLEVVVRGVRSGPRDLVVASFVVRASKGTEVYDGILERANNSWSLSLTDGGRVNLSQVPASLQAHVGERVWLARDGATSASSGVITLGR